MEMKDFRRCIWLCKILLIIIYAFDWKKSVECLVVPVGHSVVLDCFLSSKDRDTDINSIDIVRWNRNDWNSSPTVLLWRKGLPNLDGKGYEHRVQLIIDGNLARLSINDIRKSDEGNYQCQTWSAMVKPIGNATITPLQVIDHIPKWIHHPSSSIVDVGSFTELNCDIDPSPISIQWLRNGKIILNGQNEFYIDNGRLRIYIKWNLKEEQEGVYQCRVLYYNAALLSNSANITFAVLSPFQSYDKSVVNSRENGNVVLRGSIPFSIPSALPKVYKDDLQITKFDGRMQLLSSGNLHIVNVSSDDEGIYTFAAVNSISGQIVRAKHSIQLKVHVSDRKSSPQLLAAQQDLNTLNVGQNVTLECAADGNPSPNISWSKYGGILPQGRHRQILGNLFLTNIRANDTGTYICEARNGVDFQVSTICTLNVTEEPRIINWSSEQEVVEGSELVLDCQVNVYANVKWIFNGTEISSDQYVIKGNKLSVNVSERRHAGFYQCFAFNKAGIMSEIKRVRILPKIIISNSGDNGSGTNPRRKPPNLVPDDNLDRSQSSSSNDESDISDLTDKDWQRRRKQKKNKHKSGTTNDNKDESVMVRWDVPLNTGLSIQFFKVQYRVVAKHSSRWMTIDEDILPHIFSYEVPNLRTGQTYRFRIAAVYSNNDNKLGPNSHRFTLQKDPQMKKPIVGPTIISTKTVSPSAIELTWQEEDVILPPIKTSSNNQLLYIILGSVLGSLSLLLILFVGYCLCKQRRHRIALTSNNGHRQPGVREDESGEELGEYRAADRHTNVTNGHNGVSTTIFLWQKQLQGEKPKSQSQENNEIETETENTQQN
ncbi:hypothetical protein CHUAL_009005 [Chamberlinius hualienensis]